ncbi:MAG: DNA mismatch repair protein MutS [Bacteriovoracaceae bacterium]|nr:DNA mismatch repair protein MutS [Bacteriovoracaceae bacterium]
MNNTVKILADILKQGHKLTPMMEQYYEIKKNYPETLLLFRMGDFYELFFDDAKAASKILNIALTHRGKIADIPIPMAGIPHHAAHAYVDRITSQGLKAAICEQVEDPKTVTKGIVKRAVTQIASPAMPYDLDKAEKTENKFMASAIYENNNFSLCFVDFTTGDFFGLHLATEEELIEHIALYAPKEFISYLGQWDKFTKLSEFLERESLLKTYLSQEYFVEKYTKEFILKLIPNYERDQILKLDQKILMPVGALAYYIYSTQSLEVMSHIQPFRLINQQKFLKVSYSTLIGLEILPPHRDDYKDSLLGHFDKTLTSMGSRGLRKLFLSPQMDLKIIQKRHEAIEFFLNSYQTHTEVRDILKDIRDMERIMAKVSAKKANAGDLINLAQGIISYRKLKQILPASFIWNEIPLNNENEIEKLAQEILNAINDEIGASLDKGNLIKVGYNKKRDRLSKINQNVAEEMATLETKYRQETGITNLKIKSNNINGFFIEVSKSHLKKVPKHFERRQTLVNNERYLTEELIEFEKEILLAKDHLYRLEKEIFDKFNADIQDLSFSIHQINESLALCDSLQALSWMAKEHKLVKPQFETDKKIFQVKGAWHPLIKSNIKEQFVTHHIHLNDDVYFGLITGPNMAGKTTVMREVAIIQFLAQIGSFVPADSAMVGICDFMFSRLGASDDIIRGQSTFMVEMAETAEIIRHATSRSLIILDEIGRGTSTFDGLSIAWALVEYLNEKTKALTLFSTHYHELIDLVSTIRTAKNLTVKTINENGKVQFLYSLIEEGATQSFGIYVAQLAGLPKEIIKRSQQVLKRLEKTTPNHDTLIQTSSQLDFLAQETPGPVVPEYLKDLERSIQDIDIMNTTPLDALKKLDDLKQNLIRH